MQSSPKRRIMSNGTQNFAWVGINFTMRESPVFMFLIICMYQNSEADGQIHTPGDQKPLILPRQTY